LTIQHLLIPITIIVAMVETPMVETPMVETPMVEIHTVTMAMHTQKDLVLQLAVATMEMELAADSAVTAELADKADSAAAAATQSRINTQPKTIK
jgi:hypothetical protein